MVGKRFVLPIACGILCWVQVLAAEPDAALLEQLEARIELSEAINGSFTQNKFIAVLPAPLKSSGIFSYKRESYEREGALLWETREPIANRLVFDAQGIRQSVDGKTVWEVDADKPAALTITRVISSVLAADWMGLQDYFSMEGTVGEREWELRLTPNDPVLEQAIQSVTVRGDRVLRSMQLLEANGDRSEIAFTVNSAPGH